MRNMFHRDEIVKKITLVIGKIIDPRDLGMKKYLSLIQGIILRDVGSVKEIKRATNKVFNIYAQHRVGTLSYKPKISVKVARGKPSVDSSQLPRIINGLCIPNLVKRNSYRGTEQPSKVLHILSFEPTRRINQFGGLPTIMSAFDIASTTFNVEGVPTT